MTNDDGLGWVFKKLDQRPCLRDRIGNRAYVIGYRILDDARKKTPSQVATDQEGKRSIQQQGRGFLIHHSWSENGHVKTTLGTTGKRPGWGGGVGDSLQ